VVTRHGAPLAGFDAVEVLFLGHARR
jgi:hypothetical protein